MTTSYIYGPSSVRYYELRTAVDSFDEIPEPWKKYAALLDAAADTNGFADFGFCDRQQALNKDRGVINVWYLFDIDFWREHASVSS